MTKRLVCGVYCIRNTISKRKYVGSSVDIYKRWFEHRNALEGNKHHSMIFQRSWNKHGVSYFVFEILEIVPASILLEREQYWIDKLNCVKFGYNISPTAGSPLGVKHTEETKEKFRVAKLGKKRGPHSKIHRANMRISQQALANKLTQEQITERVKRLNSPEATAKRLASFKTVEFKEKKSRKNPRQSEVLKAKYAEGWSPRLGKTHTEEVKETIRRKKIGVPQSEQARKNHSNATKKWWAQRQENYQ